MVIGNETNRESNIVTLRDNCHIESSNTQNSFRNENKKTFFSLEGETLPQLRKSSVRNMDKTVTISEIDEEFPTLESYQLMELLDQKVGSETYALLYILVEYSISSFKGTAGPKSCTQEELRQCLDRIVPLGKETKSECLDKAASIQRPNFVLDFNVIEGSGLKFKNLSARLFCKMWLKRDAKVVKFTKAVNQGPNPIWNMSDCFDLTTPDGSILYIEIHRRETEIKKNADPSRNSVTGTGNGSRGKMSEHLEESDGKLKGRSEMKTSDIHCEGSDRWIPIKSPKNRNLKGHLHVAAKLRVSTEYGGLNALKRHLLLIKFCVHEHLRRETSEGTSVTCWENISTSVTSTLIFLHSVIESIPICEDSICWFSVVNHLVTRGRNVTFQFRYILLYSCVKNLRKLSKANCGIEFSLKDIYEKQFESLKKDCLNFIENLHFHDLGGDKFERCDFEYALRIILLSRAVLELSCDPLINLKTEAQKWSEKVANDIPISSEKAKYITDILHKQKEFHVAADKIIGQVYPGMTYTGVIYEHLDNFINDTLKNCVRDIAIIPFDSEDEAEEKMSIALKVFQESKLFIIHAYKSTDDREYKFLELCGWFGTEIIQNWFEWKRRVAVRQIKMALCFDDAMHINTISLNSSREKISSSVKVVPDIIQNCLTDLWELLAISGSSRYDFLFINGLHECCTVFAPGLTERNSPKNTIGDSFKRAKKRTCVLANNMNVMASFVERTVSGTVGTLHGDLPKTVEYLMDWCRKLCSKICEMHAPVIEKRVKKVAESRSKLKQIVEVNKYADFVDRVVWKEARRYMILDVFLKFLKEIWTYVLLTVEKTAFHHKVESGGTLGRIKSSFGKRKCNFEGLLQILKETEKLCSSGDRAAFTKFLWGDEFRSMQNKLIDATRKH